MEAPSLTPAPHLHALIETRLDLQAIEPSPPILNIQLPSTSAFARQTRVLLKTAYASPPSHDEGEFQRRHAATASSVFFRTGPGGDEVTYPRAIAWRVVDNSSVLEVRALDLTRPGAQADKPSQILRYAFPSAIRTGGVALADSAADKAVVAFVMTKSNELYTVKIRPALFAPPSPAPEDMQTTFQVYRPPALSISPFYKLFAPTATVVFISLGDGRLSRLTRKLGEDGAQWNEAVCDDGQWAASFRGLLPWGARPTLQFEGNALNLKTIHTALPSPDDQHVFTTGLDHTLKAWSLSSRKPTIVRDLLNLPLPEDGQPRQTLDPGLATTLRLFESRSGGGYNYYAVTFSTQKSGTFKVWAIADPDDPEGIYDCLEDKELRLPDPGDGALWTLADFDIRATADTSEIDVWVLMRLNKRFNLFHRKFFDLHSLGSEWDAGWVSTVVDGGRHESAFTPSSLGDDELDLSARWLEHIFSPNRIPLKVLETAYSVYVQTKSSKNKPLKGSLSERVAASISSQIPRQTDQASDEFTARVHDPAEKEWSNFWNIIRDVESLRWEPVSLAIDEVDAVPWIAFTDGFSAIRDCSELEMLAYNDPEDLEHANTGRVLPSVEDETAYSADLRDQAYVVSAATAFRSSFPEDLQKACRRVLSDELWNAPLASPSDRIQSLYDACNLAEEITTRQFHDLKSSLDGIGGFSGLKSHNFIAIAEAFSSPPRGEPTSVFSKIGLGALVAGARNMTDLRLAILRDLLYLAVFIFGEVDPSEDLSVELDLERIFLVLVEQLRRAQLAQWLATKTRSISQSSEIDSQRGPVSEQLTVLEDLFAGDIKPQTERGHLDRSGLTQAMQDLLTWVAGGNEISLDNALVTIQCDLLVNRNLELASSFQRFLPSSAWATYVRGRLCLSREEFSEAAICFKKAAFRLSRSDPHSSTYALSSSGLLDEPAASFFASGLSNFYSHILALFETAKEFAYALAFARLAVQHQQRPLSPEHTSDLLHRLFRAALALADFDSAASALSRIPDRDLQHAALRDLVARIVECSAVAELLRLPLPTLQPAVDALLAERARTERDQGPAGAARIPAFKILYAWRLRLGDTRGAAAVLVERLEATRATKRRHAARGGLGGTKAYEQALDEYLVGINALALVGDYKNGEHGDAEEGWVFIEGQGQPRRVVRLQDLRESYGEEMDRLGMLEMGRFGLVDYDGGDGAVDADSMQT